jgi:hypothetical protein
VVEARSVVVLNQRAMVFWLVKHLRQDCSLVWYPVGGDGFMIKMDVFKNMIRPPDPI